MKYSKYYAVTMPKAHVGVNHRGTTIRFVFNAPNALTAMDMAKKMGGVKHGKLCLKCEQITEQEYLEARKESAYKHWQ